MNVFHIASRRPRKGGRYRTQYYRECIDGKPRMGAKKAAAVFTEAEVDAICAQLGLLQPKCKFFPVNCVERPKRATPAERPQEDKPPTQTDAFEVGP